MSESITALPSELAQPQTPTLRTLPRFTMLTMLLRLLVILRNGNGDATIPEFSNTDRGANYSNSHIPETLSTPLDAFSALLIQDNEVITSCYFDDPSSVAVVVDNKYCGLGRPQARLTDCSDEDHVSEGPPSQGSPIPLRVAAIANPDDNTLNIRPALPNHDKLTIYPKGKDFWPSIKKDSFHHAMLQ